MFKLTINLCLCVLLLMIVIAIQSCSTPREVAKPAVAPPAAVVAPVPPAAPAPAPNEFIVYYDSDPPGAIMYELGRDERVGETPFWASYTLTEKEHAEGRIVIDPCRVVWPSGATASNHPGLVFNLKDGLERKYFFVRPDVPGRDDDYAKGLQRVQHRITYGEDGAGGSAGK